ncbi:DUF6069 family protein [Streptomyces lusitanus]|uniref:DUF6069 family protein n=1 Tax=Streptomyces lusitanus TaxID=68232 RepID=A0ABU3JNS4_9ACTN|nr:DUF6069 family protein [Streptomyces lusitanus]
MSARARRSGTAAAAVAVALVIWAVADPVLGHRLRMTDGGDTMTVGAAAVTVASLLAALAAWALLAALERFGVRRARAVWTGVAVAVLAVSLLPLAGDGMDGGTRVTLALMHLTVGAVLIAGLAGGSRAGRPAREGPHS